MAGEIDVAPISETKNYGSQWRPSYVGFDVKGGEANVIYESHDGAIYTGKRFRIVVKADGVTYFYSDGTQESLPNPKLDAAGVQGLVDWVKLKLVAEAKAR